MLTEVLGIVYAAISSSFMCCAGLRVGTGVRTGAVWVGERVGSGVGLNLHPHICFVDGAYMLEVEQPRFRRVRVPTYAELQDRLHAVATGALERRELLLRDGPTPPPP